MRLFVAVDVPDRIKEEIENAVVDPLRDIVEGAKWTRPEGRHLTLKFLGYVDDDRVDEVGSALETVAPTAAFDAAFEELGGFPNLRRPRVLWVGVGEGSDRFVDLAASVDRCLEPLGFAREERPFHPHLTLARFPKPRVIAEFPKPAVPYEPFRVDEVILFRSQLHPKGARYTPLARVGLQG